MTQSNLDNDWKAKIARNYFEVTWNGTQGRGVSDGKDNIDELYKSIDRTFHSDYIFTWPDGKIIYQGTDITKKVLAELTVPLINLKLTSFDIIAVDKNSITFQSTAIAKKKRIMNAIPNI